VLELGRSGSHGTERGTVPVLSGDAVVATLRSSRWKEAATAQVGDRVWVFGKRHRALVGRWEVDPADAVRLRARQTSWWRSGWVLDLEGVPGEMSSTSWWRGTHRYTAGGRTVAESGSTGGWSRRPTLTAADELPLATQVFLLWMELVISRRNDGAVAGATSAAVIGGSS
jgi:hypothetical protein